MNNDDSNYQLSTAVESRSEAGVYGVKIYVRRPPEAQDRWDALRKKDWRQCTAEERDIKIMVPHADDILQVVRKQDRLLDPETKRKEDELRSRFKNAFGKRVIFMEAIPNGYLRPDDPWAVGEPWYRVTTSIGHLVVGWRKRVIHLDWKDTILRSLKPEQQQSVPGGEEVFPNEDTTRLETGIHAWGYDDLTRYLNALFEWPCSQVGADVGVAECSGEDLLKPAPPAV